MAGCAHSVALGLRRGPHSALLDTGGDGHGPGFACGRLSLGEPLTAQSNLAFLGMWRCSTRPDLAELLPFDADAGSSSNMVSSQPGVPIGLQSWSARSKNTIRRGASYFSMEETSDLRI